MEPWSSISNVHTQPIHSIHLKKMRVFDLLFDLIMLLFAVQFHSFDSRAGKIFALCVFSIRDPIALAVNQRCLVYATDSWFDSDSDSDSHGNSVIKQLAVSGGTPDQSDSSAAQPFSLFRHSVDGDGDGDGLLLPVMSTFLTSCSAPICSECGTRSTGDSRVNRIKKAADA